MSDCRWRVEQVQSYAYQLDIFAHLPAPRLRKYRTKTGVGITLFMVGLMSWYIVFTSREYAYSLPLAARDRSPADMSAVVSPQVFLAIRDSRGVVQRNNSVFSIAFTEIVVRLQDRLPRAKRDLGSRSVAVEGTDYDWQTQGENAPDPSVAEFFLPGPARIEGTFEMPQYRYVEITIRLCCTSRTACDPSCEPYDSALKRLLDSNIGFVISAKNQLVKSERIALNNVTFQSTDFFFGKVFTRTNQRFLVDGSSSSPDLELVTRSLYVLDLRSDGNITKLYLRLADTMDVVEVLPQAFLSLIGSWGGLWSVLCLGLGSIAMYWNRVHSERHMFRKAADVRFVDPRLLDHRGRLRDLHSSIDHTGMELDNWRTRELSSQSAPSSPNPLGRRFSVTSMTQKGATFLLAETDH